VIVNSRKLHPVLWRNPYITKEVYIMKNTLDIELENVVLKHKVEVLEGLVNAYEQLEGIYKDIINDLCDKLGIDPPKM